MSISYRQDATEVDWAALRQALIDDQFHNGRTPEQYRLSFGQSYASVIAYDDQRIVGTARLLSDGVCNAYIVDVWTLSVYRNRGIARHMLRLLEQRVPGQHISLWTDTALGFYERAGYRRSSDTLYEKVVGTWLKADPEG